MTTAYIALSALLFLFIHALTPLKHRPTLVLATGFVVLGSFGFASLACYAIVAAIVLVGSLMILRFDRNTKKTQWRAMVAIVSLLAFAPLLFYRLQTDGKPDSATPLAISYFTLMLVGYFLDVARASTPPPFQDKSMIRFSSFFPILAIGPIERHAHLGPQLKNPQPITLPRVLDGLFFVSLGLFKKFVVADRLYGFVFDANRGYLDYRGPELWIFVFASLIQVFCDFSGLIDIVRGFAKLIGVDLVENFNQPYFAKSVPEIWRRWHISLVDWLRDFVYTPLALTTKNLYLATFVVMFAVGIWHSASWRGVYWGSYWGVLYGLSIFLRQRGFKPNPPAVLRIIFVNTLMALSTLFLIAESPSELGSLLSALFQSAPVRAAEGLAFLDLKAHDLAIVVIAFLTIMCVETLDRHEALKTESTRRAFQISFTLILALAAIIYGVGGSQAFIYLRY